MILYRSSNQITEDNQMAKTKGGFGMSFSFKKNTPTQKFAAIVGGEYMETTAVSEGQARHALKSRYNRKNGRQSHAFVEITFCEVRQTV